MKIVASDEYDGRWVVSNGALECKSGLGVVMKRRGVLVVEW